MDYEKKYKDALEIARKINSGEGVAAPPDWTSYEVIFPELKESKDEKIRKELIEQIAYIIPNNDEVDDEGNALPSYQERINKYRAWLEKQGEKKSADINGEDCGIDANKKVDRVIGTADHIKTALDVLNKKGGKK